MPGHKSHVTKLWLVSLLALLALVLVAPVRSLKATTGTPRPESPSRDLPDLPNHSAAHQGIITTATDGVPHVPVVFSDSNKKAEADAVEEPRVLLATPFMSCKVVTRQLISPRSLPSLYPLRC